MNSISARILAGSCGLLVLTMIGLSGCEVRGHDHDRDAGAGPAVVPAGGYAQVDLVDAHGYHHQGYYDQNHSWHGGYDDENHQHHDDPSDWHQ
jgi:hypothetical protein